MAWTDFFRRKGEAPSTRSIVTSFLREGLRISFASALPEASAAALFEASHAASQQDAFLAMYVAQLAQEGLCHIDVSGITVPWSQVYMLAKSPEHEGAVSELELPPEANVQPVLDCRGTLSEPGFVIVVAVWLQNGKSILVKDLVGATATLNGHRFFLPEPVWRLLDEVDRFGGRPEADHCQNAQELGWGKIRDLATQAGAYYQSAYLENTVVLTPQTLRLPVTKQEIGGVRVMTVAPTFDGAPSDWINKFDSYQEVQDHYDLTTQGGRVRIVLSEPVKRVLKVIKREMHGRRIAGARAEKFIHNPWAYLGDSAQEVIKEDEFFKDKGNAGAVSVIFSISPDVKDGYINGVDLSVTEQFSDGTWSADAKPFAKPTVLDEFLQKLEKALLEDREILPWDEYDLTLDGEAGRELETGKQISCLWKNQPAKRITFSEVYTLEGYSDRIEGIGLAKPIIVPVLQKPSSGKDEDSGWMPSDDDLELGIRVPLPGLEGTVNIPISEDWVDDFERKIAEAKHKGQADVVDSKLPTPLPLEQAEALAGSVREILKARDKVKTEGTSKEKREKIKRETLLVKTNFHDVNYQEARKILLSVPEGKGPELPDSLRENVTLKAHQLYGVAWFQHLVSRSPAECRGALLADDMGLGKTLQLLSLLAWYYEKQPGASPSIIFAPKSLLENWRNEAQRFFTPSFPEILVLYGDELEKRKQPLGLIDEDLHKKGITDLFRPGWVGNAKVLITTYEVLIGYEFSFAKQQFSFIICDEAQRIKTPGTQVTMAAKKLRADFRIACTGTPVENSLVDLWCLFDFVQPGLLGALGEFGQTYRRPIECDTPEQKRTLTQLQQTITPQTLRRTKADIAADLPKKLFAYSENDAIQYSAILAEKMRLEIVMSNHQVNLYKSGLKKLSDARKEVDGKTRAKLTFGALHLMKAVCAEPYCIPGLKFLADEKGDEAHLTKSQKMAWLLEQLEIVKERNEKAIVFTELRQVQNALAYFIRQRFGLKPFIINGDSEGRQSYIDSFSAGSGFNVIILSTLAAGTGLNVTAANHVFHFTRAWNPAKENQATDRAFRIGQQRDVFVYCPTMVTDEFTTFEVRLDEMMRRKGHLAHTTLDGSSLSGMLNGTGGDIGIKDLVKDTDKGAPLEDSILTMNDIDRMDGNVFEHYCNVLWGRFGYQSRVTDKVGGDGGIDVVATAGKKGDLIQCKTSINDEIGWDAVKEVVGGATKYQLQYRNVRFSRVAITNRRFSKAAVEQAQINKVRLIERAELSKLLEQYPVNSYDLDEELQSIYRMPNAA